MRRISNDALLAVLLLIALTIFTIAAAVQQTNQQRPPALSHSSANPDGAKALSLWMQGNGYKVSAQVSDQFEIPENTDVVFLLEPFPFPPISELEWLILDEWVEQGGLLISAAQGLSAVQVADHYEIELLFLDEPIQVASPLFPILLAPPQTQPVSLDSRVALDAESVDTLVLLADEAGALAVQFEQGQGDVVFIASSKPFTNEGLKQKGSGEFVLNLLAGLEAGSQIWFDEWHHNVRPSQIEISGPGSFLRYTSVGRALLYVAAVFFIALVLSGRHFGRPLRLLKEMKRRTRGEYVTSLANLYRRSGHRRMVLDQLRMQLKRELGRRYRLDAQLSDEIYLQRLSRIRADLPIEELRSLLAQLAQTKISESKMVELSAQVSDWLDDHNFIRS